jgi:hypothetical protein
MPPRITRKSTRPRASDRPMVDTVQPHGLLSFRNRSASSLLNEDAAAEMEQRKTNPGARHQTSVFHSHRGLDVAEILPPSGRGRSISLTSPFIDQAISLVEDCRSGTMSALAILRPNQQAARYTERVFMSRPELVLVARFKIPAESVLSGRPKHNKSPCAITSPRFSLGLPISRSGAFQTLLPLCGPPSIHRLKRPGHWHQGILATTT